MKYTSEAAAGMMLLLINGHSRWFVSSSSRSAGDFARRFADSSSAYDGVLRDEKYSGVSILLRRHIIHITSILINNLQQEQSLNRMMTNQLILFIFTQSING
jgi:hypothetical protein